MRRIRAHDPMVVLMAVLVVAALLAATVAFAVGADLVAMLLGGAIVAVAMVGLVGLWLVPARRQAARAERRAEQVAREQGSRTRRAVHAAERRLYTQLEALAWLRDELELPIPLPPMRGAAASPDLLLELTRIIERTRPDTILELGSGISTVVMAARCKAAGRGHVIALEHSASYADSTRAELFAQGLQAHATVIDAPLEDVTIGDRTWSWYARGPEIPDEVDLLLVDGPPASLGPLARYPALVLLQDRLAPGAVVIVDDGDRADEREMIKRWQSDYPAMDVVYLPFAKGAWTLTTRA